MKIGKQAMKRFREGENEATLKALEDFCEIDFMKQGYAGEDYKDEIMPLPRAEYFHAVKKLF